MPQPSHVIDAPVSLGGFFPAESDEEETEELDNCYEVQDVRLCGRDLKVRQYAYHSHNANRVWPGTFNLAEYLLHEHGPDDAARAVSGRRPLGSLLELGSATGVLSIRLFLSGLCEEITTSDVDDEHGDVIDNIRHNFRLNGVAVDRQPTHVPHTWGTGWHRSARAVGVQDRQLDTIVASDILLYVSAYPALVTTLAELMPASRPKVQFLMSWNRRMKESDEFFDRMKAAGFDYEHMGKCVFRFARRPSAVPGPDSSNHDDVHRVETRVEQLVEPTELS